MTPIPNDREYVNDNNFLGIAKTDAGSMFITVIENRWDKSPSNVGESIFLKPEHAIDMAMWILENFVTEGEQ